MNMYPKSLAGWLDYRSLYTCLKLRTRAVVMDTVHRQFAPDTIMATF